MKWKLLCYIGVYIGIVENKMETTIGIRFGLHGVHLGFRS